MTKYTRSGHNRHRNGNYHSVREHTVNRPDGIGSLSNREVAARWHYADEDFTRPSICNRCGKTIFFVRHNGGSVLFDDLGYPWMKHECCDASSSSKSAGMFNTIELIVKGQSTALLGVIIETGSTIKIRLSNGTIFNSASINDTSFLGSFVVIVPVKNKIWAMTVIDHNGNTLAVNEITSLHDALGSLHCL